MSPRGPSGAHSKAWSAPRPCGNRSKQRADCSFGREGSPTSATTAASAEIVRLGAVRNDALELQLERLPRHHLFAEIPAALRDWLLPIEWERELLWGLELPRRRLGLEELRWHLDLPWWRRNGIWFQVTPREYLSRPDAHPEHADRVASAELSYPLHVIRRRERWLILDGTHRLTKAEMLGLRDIVVSTLTPTDLASIARPHNGRSRKCAP